MAITIVYTIKIDLNSTDVTAATLAVNNTITNYINSLWVGADVIHSEVNRLIKGVSGILDVEVLTLNGSPSNVVTTASQVARVSTITPTVTS